MKKKDILLLVLWKKGAKITKVAIYVLFLK